MITVYIDEITPCLRDTITGDFLDTEVVRLKRKSFLSKFNKKTGWYVNWGKMPSNVEGYNVWRMPVPGRPFHFVMEETFAQTLREVYTYEWSSEEL